MGEEEKHSIHIDEGALEALRHAAALPNLDGDSEDTITDICMFFGAAAYYAQFFEAALADFLVSFQQLAIRNCFDTGHDLSAEKLDKQTLGALLHKFKSIFEVDPEITSTLSDALQQRNELMHHFFKKRHTEFAGKESRDRILGDLIHVGLLFKKAMIMVRGMISAIDEAIASDVEQTE